MFEERSFEDVLEEQYPQEIALGDRRKLVIRPLEAEDREALLQLFRRIPNQEKGRFFREPATDPKVVASWCENIDPAEVLSLVAVDGDRIVADGTLHSTRSHMKHHVGEVRLTVDPEYRQAGLGTKIVTQLLDLAPGLGIEWVDAEVSENENEAMRFLEHMRFQEHGRLPDHARDGLGGQYDVILMSRNVGREFEPDIGGEG